MLSQSALGGEMVKGKHEPLVSQEVFLKANNNKHRIYDAAKNPDYESTPLKGLVRCDTCGEYLRGYVVKKKGLYYYKCNSDKRCGCNKSAKELHQKFTGILEELRLDEKYTGLFREQLKLVYLQVNEDKDKANEAYQKQMSELEQKTEQPEERFINEEIKSDLYEKFAEKFRKEREEIEDRIKACPVNGLNLDYYIERSIELAT